jgi:hypothetical protein
MDESKYSLGYQTNPDESNLWIVILPAPHYLNLVCLKSRYYLNLGWVDMIISFRPQG